MKFLNNTQFRLAGIFAVTVTVLLVIQVFCSRSQIIRTPKVVHAPPVYEQAQAKVKLAQSEQNKACEGPEPYKGDMEFRSRYEGSGSSRSKVNKTAEQSYLEATKGINDLQKFISKETDAIIKQKSDQDRLECILQTLSLWANESDLDLQTDNHTGKAVRKWTLAALSSNLLKVRLLAEQYDPDALDEIKLWLGKLADQVVVDYTDKPIEKINNHDYWAAWSVITTSALLDRHDLFDWSKNVFSTAMHQVNEQGFLPNELSRKSRAAHYHNYAMTPLTGIAAFLAANGTNPFQFNNEALARLNGVLVDNMNDGTLFDNETGVNQSSYDVTIKGRLAWLAIYVTVDHLSSSATNRAGNHKLSQDIDSLTSTRMGGDLGFLYLGKENSSKR